MEDATDYFGSREHNRFAQEFRPCQLEWDSNQYGPLKPVTTRQREFEKPCSDLARTYPNPPPSSLLARMAMY